MTSTQEQSNSPTFNVATKAWLAVTGLLLIGLVAGTGAFFGTRFAADQKIPALPLELQAATSANNDSLSMSTGSITNEVEGLWLLDHGTGKLQCWVMSPRTGAVAAIFTTNVANDLDISKGKPELIMTTGSFFFTGGKVGNKTPAQSICYVANTTSGVVAGYSVNVNRTQIQRGQTQAGELRKVCTGKIKEAETTRDQ